MKKYMSNIKFILYHSYIENKLYPFIMILYIVLKSSFPLIIILYPGKIINALNLDNNLQAAIFLVLQMSALLIASQTVIHYLEKTLKLNRKKVKNKLKEILANQCMSIDYEYLEDISFLNKIKRADSAVTGKFEGILNFGVNGEKGIEAVEIETLNIISGVIRLVGLLYILLKLNLIIVGFLLLMVIINAILSSKNNRIDLYIRKKTDEMSWKTHYIRKVMNDFESGKDIRLFNLSEFVINKFIKNRTEYLNERKKHTSEFLKINWLSNLINIIQEASINIFMAIKVLNGALNIGDFVIYVSSVNNFVYSLTNIIDSVIKIKMFNEYISDYIDIVEMDSPKQDATELIGEIHTIKFNNVWFKYPGTEKYVLKDINFTINAKEKISMIGRNGAGKTTIIKLIARLHKPTKGTITINGKNILNYSKEEYRSKISAIFQDYKLFDLTVAENISLKSSLDKEEIEKAWKVFQKVGIADKINTLQYKEETQVFKEFDKDGVIFSGGQLQKLAWARCLLKETPIVLVDEPTSALDPETEFQIYRTFNEILKEKTVLFISHRMASTFFCDRIIVFKNGKLIEDGVHDELINKKGEYFDLYSTQALHYNTFVGKD